MKRKGLSLSIIISLVFYFCIQAEATILDFTDNVALPPGFYGYLYYNNYTADKQTNHSGDNTFHLDLSTNVAILKPAYYFKLSERTFALFAYLPFGTVSSRGVLGNKERSSGLGDIVINPAVSLYENNRAGTFLSFYEYISIPTGNWSENRALRSGPNLGLHYWYLEHELSFAQVFGKFTYDMNINYFQRFEEPSLNTRYGDSFEVEGILGYGITDRLRAGVYADCWTDINDTKVDGTTIDHSKRRFFSIGPSLAYGTDKWAVHFRFVPDVISENGPKGYQTWLRLFYSF